MNAPNITPTTKKTQQNKQPLKQTTPQTINSNINNPPKQFKQSVKKKKIYNKIHKWRYPDHGGDCNIR